MATKTPPLEDTRALILKAKGPKWLKEKEAEFAASYGNSVKEPALRLWLIAKQNGLDVQEIKATTEGGEGEEKMISEIVQLAKSPEDQGWTLMKGGKIEQPESQDKYNITGVILETEEGETSTKKPKLDFRIADATGIAKGVAYADAVGLFVEAKAKVGSVVQIPLCNVQYGRHDFGREKQQVWWKFAVPPFGSVRLLDRDPKEFFLNMEEDVVKEGKACFTTGFITDVSPRTVEVCNECDRWVLEKKPADHDKCREKCDEEGREWESREQTDFEGTLAAINGQTRKLNLRTKPKIKLCVDQVEVFGSLTKSNAIQVAFLRKSTLDTSGEEDAAPAPKAVPKARPASKPMLESDPPTEDMEPEEDADDAAVEAPAPTKAKPVVQAPKKAAKPAPPPDEEPAQDEEQQAPPARKPVKKPAPKPPVEEEEEQAEEPTVIVKAASKIPSAKGTTTSPAKGGQATVSAVPKPVLEHIQLMCKQFGKPRVFVLTRSAVGNGVPGFADLDEQEARSQMEAYVAKLVEGGTLQYENPTKSSVIWVS